ncbi:hypothetical protein KY285_010937 [Solanum tuberosum]|nr:hypothetical protein KY289_011509 [Solanum tuberosum]KAH0709596.1 hypothetical protein KY284_011023 [Solanum tuberosum]KAH0735230.1 hypothetical protein KY285_010937 [Solanum tuberosum]
MSEHHLGLEDLGRKAGFLGFIVTTSVGKFLLHRICEGRELSCASQYDGLRVREATCHIRKGLATLGFKFARRLTAFAMLCA